MSAIVNAVCRKKSRKGVRAEVGSIRRTGKPMLEIKPSIARFRDITQGFVEPLPDLAAIRATQIKADNNDKIP
eukprot:1875817-Pleurochrysis_carterae.AAC.3